MIDSFLLSSEMISRKLDTMDAPIVLAYELLHKKFCIVWFHCALRFVCIGRKVLSQYESTTNVRCETRTGRERALAFNTFILAFPTLLFLAVTSGALPFVHTLR
jgi:hypothetical protein